MVRVDAVTLVLCVWEEVRKSKSLYAGAFMSDESKDPQNTGQLEGRYANYFEVGHNAFEFVLDFGQVYAGESQQGQFHTRIVTAPVYANTLLKTLQGSIDRYEKTFGVIPEDSEPSDKGG